MKNKKIFIPLISSVLIISLVLINFREPLLDRTWDADVSVLANIPEMANESFIIENARDWSYDMGIVETQDYFTDKYLFQDLEGMTFYVQPLDHTGLIAHTFIVFNFIDSYDEYKDLGISVETRRESGEQYSILGGLFRKFELTHTWATKQDLIDRRTKYYDYSLEPHLVTIPKDQQITILKEFLYQTDKLSREPVFYNTALNNCTNALAQYINRVAPDSIPWHYSFVLTGRSDEYLRSLGFIK